MLPKLVRPSTEYRAAFVSMAEEWRAHGVVRYDLALEDFDAYLALVERASHRELLPEGWVPGTDFWLDDGTGQIVACVRLRFWLTPELEVEGGHIGYDVRPSARRRGFGTAALQLVLPEARHHGLERVLLTTDADNIGSIAIIERCGGVFSGELVSARSGKPVRRYWLDTPR